MSTGLGRTENRKMMHCFSTESLVQNICMRNVIRCESHFSVTCVIKCSKTVTVKPVLVATSIKQAPVLSKHFYVPPTDFTCK